MVEKKLTDEVVVAKNAITDEEIAKAILQQIEYNAGIPYIDEWLKVKTIKFTDILNFIHRLKKENEELKSPKFASWKLKFFNLKEEFDKELAEHEEFVKKAKAEIERLTKWKDKLQDTKDELEQQLIDTGFKEYCEENKQLTKENAELQKQVDELRESANGLLLTSLYKKQADDHKRGLSVQRSHWEKKVQQAVKDTAKEISKKVVDLNVIYGDDFRLFLDNFELWVKERYGVSYEENN